MTNEVVGKVYTLEVGECRKWLVPYDDGKQVIIPFPICEKCQKEVEEFTVKIEHFDIKCGATCHGSSYEMCRIAKKDLEGVKEVIRGTAFKDNRSW